MVEGGVYVRKNNNACNQKRFQTFPLDENTLALPVSEI
jgi:hypothetical protein